MINQQQLHLFNISAHHCIIDSLTTKKQTTKFSSANFKKKLRPSYIILTI